MSTLVRTSYYEINHLQTFTEADAKDQTYYRATPIGAATDVIEVDINMPSGIYKLSDSGDYKNYTVRYEIAYKRLGAAAWTVNKYEVTGRTPDEIGFTHRFNVSYGVYDVAMYRLTTKSNDSQIMDKIYCNGLKSVIAKPVSYPDVTVILMRITGDQVLSEMNENQLSTLWKRKLEPLTGGDLERTVSIAPAVKYIVSNSKYPDILDDAALSEFNKKWDLRGLNLNGVLDKDNTLLDVLRDVLNVGFAEPIVKGGELTFTEQGVRDNLDLSYVFQPQNMLESPALTVTLPKSDDVQEVVAEYMNPDTWKTDQIYIHSAASNDGDIVVTEYPVSKYQDKISLFGVTSKTQAIAMAARRLNYLKYTKYTVDIKTELEGLNVSYNDFVCVYIDQIVNTEKTGRVLSYNQHHKEIVISNVTELTAEEKNSFIIRDTAGKPHICKITATELITDAAGITRLKCTLLHELPFAWSKLYGSKYEYPYFVAGTDKLMMCWVQNVTNSGNTCTVKLVNYDERMYKNDIYMVSGWGHCPWGHCPWGHSGKITGNGWGHGIWGHSAWGHGYN